MAIRIKNGHYIVYWREPGSGRQLTKRCGTGINGKAAAEEFENRLGLKHNIKSKAKSGKTLHDIMMLYRANHRLANENCEKHRLYRLGNIISELGGVDIFDFSAHHIDKYVRTRQASVKNSTVNRELNDLQAIFNFAVSRKILLSNPVSGYQKLPNDDEIIIPPTSDEISIIYNAAYPHIKRFIVLCSYIIARPGKVEVLSIEWRQVAWGALVINIIGAAKNKEKQPKRRQAPIQPGLMEYLKRWYADDKTEFGAAVNRKTIIHYNGSRVAQIGKSWRATLLRAGIDRRIRPYDLRQRSIADVLDNGGDIQALSDIVGSAPATIMKHYRHVSRSEHRKAAALVRMRIDEDDQK